jgi:hypothetical protein
MRSRFSLLPLCLAAVMSVASLAVSAQGLPSTGLGQSWPNAADVSANHGYHVFVFERLGTRYVQVNDLDGNVRAAFAYAGDQIQSLPMGLDATRLSTPAEPFTESPVGAGEVVYRDSAVTIMALPGPAGTTMFKAEIGDCKNPAECSVHGQ